MSPYQLVFGLTPNVSLQLELGRPLVEPMTQTEYAHTVHRVLKDIRQIANDHLAKARARQSRQYGKINANWVPFNAGRARLVKAAEEMEI